MENLTGHTLKGYELLERIGSGGFGAVYRAYQSTVGREVAVKVILPHFANRPDFIRRFEAEAQLVARLEHLHIVPLYDYWRDPDGAYLVMRWLRGGSLKDALGDGNFDLEPAAQLLDQVAAALSMAHMAEVVHRDLKPANILLDEEGNAYLADFGIALDLRRKDGEGIDEDGEAVIGSPAYLAPEQIRDETATPQTDIYILGITLYELLSGAHPFADLNAVELMYKQINDPLPPLPAVADGASEEINAVIQKATAKDPRHRYQDALSLAAAFRKAARLEKREAEELIELLTQREQEVLELIVGGLTNRQIAQELTIEHSTVKWYIRQIYSKLGVRGRRQAIARFKEMEAVATQQVETAAETTAHDISLPPPSNPYKGLRPFAAADRDDFFGREALVARLLERLALPEEKRPSTTSFAAGRFLAVVGPSGSGKSSLIHAGLIPALWHGRLPGSERWFVVDFTPGARPLDELEVALIRVAADQADNLRRQLERDANGLLRAAGLILPQDDSELVLVIDQFEELFSLAEDEEERSHFLQLLTTAVSDTHSRVRIILTLRADYYDRPLHYPDFGQLMRRHMETVLPLKAGELERAIVRPTEAMGVAFEPGLVAAIIDDVLYQPGALPLLQYALTELFAAREGRLLTHTAYQAIGGAIGALARRAEELYGEQDPFGRELLRQLFLRLVAVGEGDETDPDTRRRVPQSELMALSDDEDLSEELIDLFAAYRLLTLDHDPASRRPTVEIAHEALLREWERLRGWLADSRDDLYQHRRLQTLVGEWLAAGRDEGLLLRQARLDQLAAWAGETDLVLSEKEREFLEASLAARRTRRSEEAERQQRELETAQKLIQTERQRAAEQSAAAARLRRRAVLLTGAAILAAVLAVAAFLFAGQAGRNEEAALSNASLAASRELAAAAQLNLETDPELGMLLALAALAESETVEAVNALHQAVQASRLEQTLYGHSRFAFWLQVSPDGRSLTSSALNGSRVWDLTGGESRFTLPGYDVSFGDDGRLLTFRRDEENRQLLIHTWAADGEQLESDVRNIVVEGTGFWRYMFNPEPARLAIIHEDGRVELWDVEAREQIRDWTPHPRPLTDFLYSPDGELLVTVAGDAAIWDGETGEALLTLPANASDVAHRRSVAFSPDGRLLATNGADAPGDVIIWDVPASLAAGEGQRLMTLPGHTNLINAFAFNADGSLLATASQDRTARVWRLGEDDGRSLYTLSGHETGVMNVTFAQDGERLVTGDQAGLIRIWNITPNGGRERFTLQYPGALFRLDYSPEQGQFAATSLDGRVKIWEADGGEPLHTWAAHEGQAYDVAYSPNGRFLATSGPDNQTIVWEAASGTRQFAVAGHDEGVAADIFPNFQAIAYSPDGRTLVTGGVDGRVKFWNAATGASVSFPGRISIANDGEPAPIINLAYSPDGRYLLVTGDSEEATLFEVASGEEVLTFPAGFRGSLAFSPDGTRLAIGNWEGELRLYDFEASLENVRPALLHTLRGHINYVNSLAFSPDGSALVSGSLDGDTQVWAVDGGERRFTLSGSGAGVAALHLFDDGQTILTIGLDGSVRAYLMETAALATLAQTRLTRWWRPEECRRYLHQPDCPAPPETIAMMETAVSPEKLNGVWQAVGPSPFPYLEFREDNTLAMADSSSALSNTPPVTMTFAMDAGKLLVTNERCGDAVGVYAVRLLHDPVEKQRMVLSMQSDPCQPRWGILAQEFARTSLPFQPPKSGEANP